MNLARRHLQGGLRALLVVALVLAAAKWIQLSRPDGPSQHAAPVVRLDPAQVAAAEQMPISNGVVPVLTYHGVSEQPTDEYTVSPQQLSAHLAALARGGFESISLATLQDLLAGREVQLPARPILLTFDDGNASTWRMVDPILRSYGFRAVSFLITGSIAEPHRRSYYLTTDEVRSLQSTGRWEFGGHTHLLHRARDVAAGEPAPALDHRVLRPDGELESLDEWRQRIRDDLAQSQQYLDGLIGHPATAFAYPFSASGVSSNDPAIEAELPTLLADAGYTTAFIGEQADTGAAVFPDSDPMHLHRLGVRASSTVEEVLQRIARVNPTPMPADLTDLQWTGDQVRCEVDSAAPGLTISNDGGFGRCEAAGNPARWQDYRLNVDLTGASRTTTAIVSLRELENSYGTVVGGRLEVSVGESTAEIREVVGRTTTVLHRIDLDLDRDPDPDPPSVDGTGAGATRHLEVWLHGSTALVRIDELPGVAVQLSPETAAGGVSFRIASIGPGSFVAGSPALDQDAAAPTPAGCPSGAVALTFDDGPGPVTAEVLDLLQYYRVPAAFFVLGSRVAEHPELVRRAAAEGHLVGSHGWTHTSLTSLGAEERRADLERASETIAGSGAPRPAIFRPPYGDTDVEIDALARSLGMETLLWSLAPLDSPQDEADELTAAALARLSPGAVVLLPDSAATTGFLPGFIEGTRAAGYCIALPALSGSDR